MSSRLSLCRACPILSCPLSLLGRRHHTPSGPPALRELLRVPALGHSKSADEKSTSLEMVLLDAFHPFYPCMKESNGFGHPVLSPMGLSCSICMYQRY
jgi:hypothetical protein